MSQTKQNNDSQQPQNIEKQHSLQNIDEEQKKKQKEKENEKQAIQSKAKSNEQEIGAENTQKDQKKPNKKKKRKNRRILENDNYEDLEQDNDNISEDQMSEESKKSEEQEEEKQEVEEIEISNLLEVPPTPPSPSTAGASHFDVAELNTHVKSEREYKEWQRNLRHAVEEMQNKTTKFPSVANVWVVGRIVVAMFLIIGLSAGTIITAIISLKQTSNLGNRIILGSCSTSQILLMQYLSLQLLFNTNFYPINLLINQESSSPIFIDTSYLLNDQQLIQQLIQKAIKYARGTESHLRYGSTEQSITNDILLDKLKTKQVEGDYESLDQLMLEPTECLLDPPETCEQIQQQRNHLVTSQYTGLDSLFQQFISDLMHISMIDISELKIQDDRFLRLVSLGNNDLYQGNVRYTKELHQIAQQSLKVGRSNILIITIVDVVVFFVVFLFLLVPLRRFFSDVVDQTKLLNELVPEQKNEDLQWSEKYVSGYGPLDMGNKQILTLLSSIVEICEDRDEGVSTSNVLRVNAQNLLQRMKIQFNRELNWMEQNEFQFIEDHKQEHKYILKEAGYLLRFLIHYPDSSLVISNALQLFFINHIIYSDQSMGIYINLVKSIQKDDGQSQQQQQLLQQQYLQQMYLQQNEDGLPYEMNQGLYYPQQLYQQDMMQDGQYYDMNGEALGDIADIDETGQNNFDFNNQMEFLQYPGQDMMNDVNQMQMPMQMQGQFGQDMIDPNLMQNYPQMQMMGNQQYM
ncbi:MAG: hypothetical protein EZS28_008753 [Streblomastix strix]|uniref:Uncharacterized protein n=1 Tax=Streblomastix strix TaxID=222440 RepID=A0A5J4WME0_9EUKA|nr:MAG: hypothetical protein EZS28_008753 [Streblomastix strix]